MPNWCQGSLKVRGKRKDVRKFFTEGVNVYEHFTKDDEHVEVLVPKDDWLYIDLDASDESEYIYYNPNAGCYSNSVYIEETNRAFIDDDNDPIIIPVTDDDCEVVVYAPIKQAWDFRIDDWAKLSGFTQLHFKLYGIEKGGGFVHSIDVDNGQVLEDKTTSFESDDDFIWNCPFPWMGG